MKENFSAPTETPEGHKVVSELGLVHPGREEDYETPEDVLTILEFFRGQCRTPALEERDLFFYDAHALGVTDEEGEVVPPGTRIIVSKRKEVEELMAQG